MVDNIQTDEDAVHYCEVHPDKETELRCNKCGRFMCAQCAVSTPVGYRCKQCVRQVEDTFFTGTQNDYLVAFAVVTGLSALASAAVSWLGFFLLLAIFGAIVAAGGISEAALRAIQRRRGRYTGEVAAGGAVLGGIIGGALFAYLNYASTQAAEFAELFRQAGRPVPAEFARMTYVYENTLTLPVILFTGITAYLVYTRMKS